jgi:hypothetical protein
MHAEALSAKMANPSVQHQKYGSYILANSTEDFKKANLSHRPVNAHAMSATAHEGREERLSSSRARHMTTLRRSLPAATYRGRMHDCSTGSRRYARQTVHAGRTCREYRLESHDATVLRICCVNAIRASNLLYGLVAYTMHASKLVVVVPA